MGVDETIVDLLSLEDFERRLQPRLDEVNAVLTVLTTAPGADPPMLGEFHDARLTTARHQNLHDEYVARARHLVDSLVVAQAATAAIIAGYRTVEELNRTSTEEVGHALSRGE